MRRLLALTVVAVLTVPLAVQAATLTVTFPAERREVHGPVPAVVEVASLDTSAVAGQSCAGTFAAVNNDSEHDTDLLLDTNGSFVVALDIERGTATVRDLGVFTVSDVLVVKLRLNEHNARGFAVSSLGGTVTLDCQEPPSTTTTTPTSTPTSSVPTTTTSPTTTSPTSSLPTVTSTSTTSTLPTTVPSSSTSVPAPSTTAPTGSSTTPSTLPPELPHTGATGAGTIAAAALALLGLGGLSVLASREGEG